MKNKKLGIIILIFIVSLGFVAYRTNGFDIKSATADSGFDSGGGGGGFSGGGGGSWSSSGSSSSHRSGSSSGDSGLAVVIFILFWAFIFCITAISYQKSNNKSITVKEYVPDKLKEHGMNEEEIMKIAYNTYVEIQKAWMDIEIDRVKDKLSDEIYNMYKMQLITLKRNKQHNIMSDFNYIGGYIYDIDDSTDNISISVVLNVNCKDYISNDEDQKVVSGNKNKLWDYTYTIDFLIAKSLDDVLDECPNCGAELDKEAGSRLICPYCRTLLVRNSPTLVMTRKHMEEEK
jgi:preprotein translocase subunit SecG/DNA-directed RNA polymerase subunit RPC12/RpoP